MRVVLSETVPARSIGGQERTRMYELMEAGYLGMERPTFDRDLAEKDDVMLLRDGESGEIVGFSTLMVMDLQVQGALVRAVFSGDSIVQDEFRRTPGLAVELAKYFRRVAGRYPSDPLFWLLISKGCRTYCLLPLFFREFYPRYDAEIPPTYVQIMDAFGARKYPAEYDPADHLVHYHGAPQRLRPGVADATDRRLRDPHVQFFLRANPGHMRGDDLVCVADAREGNWSPLFRRRISG